MENYIFATDIDGNLQVENNMVLIFNQEMNKCEWIPVAPENIAEKWQEETPSEPAEQSEGETLPSEMGETSPSEMTINVNNKVLQATKSNHWDKDQTLLLLEACTNAKDQLNNPRYKKRDIFRDIADKLQQTGYHFTAIQCENRMKTLTTKYKEVIDHNNTSGTSAKDWIYFDLMADYFGERPNVKPMTGCSNHEPTKALPKSSSKASLLKEELALKKCAGTPAQKTCGKANQKRNTPRSEFFRWLKDYEKKVEKREEDRLNTIKEIHNENKLMIAKLMDKLNQ